MSTPGFAPEWLALREGADADARSTALVDRLVGIHLNRDPLVVRDLGCGTGSQGRWLGRRLGGAQHWVLHDRDPRLLDLARSGVTGPGVTAETREGDLTALTAADLAGTSLVTASALLDLLTADQVRGLAGACAGAGCPALFTLSVVGRVEFAAAEALDAAFEAAFNDHQRRGGLLGPDAVGAAAAAFGELGATVTTSPSPWRLGPERAALAREWLRGWVGAAVEQEPGLADEAPDYLRRKAADPRVVVHHADLLAVPS
ncbi:class I SAM-dependent methyltransferase [Saccharothrix yanglingensis]|uniref:SAM-dependent methyltransferase n=1 Tax=Saccharothrix yanglingensis TaxID=659496 RepID=A0ABU0X5B9_9PSEU|nr:class I SAM-dependent methyltransferase [Saccharothrix yanglingensis]MDQ2587332.1 SAM-dependent methyltransferase [Saccharothrix yanglingensis]